MKQNGALHKIMEDEFSSPGSELVSNILYAVASDDTPLRKDAFELSDEEKIKAIAGHFRAIMNTLGLDLQNDSLKNTPERVAKMFVREIFSGLDPGKKPSATLFDNKYSYKQMLVEKNISLYSTCSDNRESAYCLYINRQDHRIVKDQSHCTILFSTTTGTGKTDHSNSE